MAKRVKKMPVEEFQEIREREWRAVKLVGEAVPTFLQGIPSDVLNCVVASGTLLPGLQYSGGTIASGELVGGIDVYRNAPDDPVELNKDWYPVVRVSGKDTLLLVPGPVKEKEGHWLDEIPARLKGAEVLAIPGKKNAK